MRHHRGQRRLNRHKSGHRSWRLQSLEREKTCRTWTPSNEGGKPWRVHPERGLAVRATASQGRRPQRAKATQCRCSCRRSYFFSDKLKSRPKVRQKIPINQGRSGHWDSKDGTEKMRRLGACDRLRAERFLPPGATDPDAVSGNMDPNPAESIAKNAQHHGAIPHLPRGKGPWRLERWGGR